MSEVSCPDSERRPSFIFLRHLWLLCRKRLWSWGYQLYDSLTFSLCEILLILLLFFVGVDSKNRGTRGKRRGRGWDGCKLILCFYPWCVCVCVYMHACVCICGSERHLFWSGWGFSDTDWVSYPAGVTAVGLKNLNLKHMLGLGVSSRGLGKVFCQGSFWLKLEVKKKSIISLYTLTLTS